MSTQTVFRLFYYYFKKDSFRNFIKNILDIWKLISDIICINLITACFIQIIKDRFEKKT